MKSFYLITNEVKDPALQYTDRVISFLQKQEGCKVVRSGCSGSGSLHTDVTQIPGDTDCVLVLGGDGTLLQAARDLYTGDIPLIGINLGNVGYLAEIEVSHMEEALLKLIQDEYMIEERMMLTGVVEGSVQAEGKAFNDVVITRSGSLQIVQYDIYVNDCFLYSCQADGMIVSTPTGASGYNMSAGGPIVSPVANLILLTPICSHSMNNRSIVLSPDDRVKIVIPNKAEREQKAEVHFDGRDAVPLCEGDSVTICRAKETTKIVKLNQESFITVLHKKMNGV